MRARTLKLTQALNRARETAKSARSAHEAKPEDVALKAAYLGAVCLVISAAKALGKADSGARAKMKKVTERYSEKKERLEESDDEEEEEEEEANSSSASSAESSEMKSSKEEEEEESAATAKSEEEEEEEEERGESEEEEEEALVAAYASAHRAYKGKAKGIDAYAVRGPRALLKAVLKATGETTIAGAMGALAAMPRNAKAAATVAADVAKLKAAASSDKIEGIVAEAKADGRAPTKALRAELRELGAKMGATYLRGFVAKLPKLGTSAKIPKADERGNPIGAPTAFAQERMMGGQVPEKDRELAAKIEGEIVARKQRANGAGRPAL